MVAKLVKPFVANIFMALPSVDILQNRSYDVAIAAPAPNVDLGIPCIKSVPLVYFGVSDVPNWVRENLSRHRECLELIVAREKDTFDSFKEHVAEIPKHNGEYVDVLLSGD